MKIIKNSPHADSQDITLIRLVDSVDRDLMYKEILQKTQFSAKYKEILYLPESNILFIGTQLIPATKHIDPYCVADYYELGATAFAALESYKITDFRILDCGKNSSDLQSFLLGMMQRSWKFDKYIATKSLFNSISIHLSDNLSACFSDDDKHLLMSLNQGILLTRELVEDVPEAINPSSMKKIIKDSFADHNNVQVQIIEYKELLKRGMEGITCVGRASRHEPMMAHVTLKAKQTPKLTICLVGKGVTYDSGGYDIKTGGHMLTMKMDMAGAATMFGVIKTLALQGGLDAVEVHWISPFVENLIDGSAYKSDDIMTTYSGLTVEVQNTDAEGRLILSDALTYATLQNPTYIVDAATLTGAAVMAVSEYYTALMSNDGELANSLLDAFEEEKEKTIYTPLVEILRDSLKGRISDLVNISSIKRQAGHKTAGLFLSNFVDQNLFRRKEELGIKEPKAYPWVHLDIAGSAYNSKNNSLNIEGATGQSVRSLVKWIIKLDQENT